MSRIVVTGSAGNIGNPLVEHLRAHGHTVLEVDTKPAWRDDYLPADIRNAADLLPIISFKPEVIYHLASMVSRVTCEAAASSAIDINVHGTQNIIQIAKTTGARLIYFSTSEVYGPGITLMREDGPVNPNNRYGLSKLLGEQLATYEADQHGLDAVILRPFMMYDESEDMGAHRSAMIRFAEELYYRRPVIVHRGSARGWLHVSDAVEVIRRAGEYESPPRIINIGHPDIRPIKELARMIAREYGTDSRLIIEDDLPSQMTSVKNPHLDRQAKSLNFAPSVSLEDGVRLVCDAMRKRLAGQVH